MAAKSSLAAMIASAPHGEYQLYTNIAKAFSGIENSADAHVVADGNCTFQKQNVASADVDTLSELARSKGQEERFFDYLACVASCSTNEIKLGNGRTTIMLTTDSQSNKISVARLSVSIPQNTQAELVIRQQNQAPLLVQLVVNVGKNASVALMFIEDSADKLFTRTTISQSADSHTYLFLQNTQSVIARNEVDVQLLGEGASLEMGGIYRADQDHKVDNVTTVRHLVGNCSSNQLFKGIANDESKISFSGLIVVPQGSQKTMASQVNRHMLNSEKAHAYAKPQLEIYADDVKCSHGATTGQLDATQLFYMQQRGIDENTARQLLSAAFLSEVLAKIPAEDIRTELTNSLTKTDEIE